MPTTAGPWAGRDGVGVAPAARAVASQRGLRREDDVLGRRVSEGLIFPDTRLMLPYPFFSYLTRARCCNMSFFALI